MRFKISLVVFLFLFVIGLQAQSVLVEGHVRDSITKEPLGYVSSRLLKTDSTFVKGVTSTESGSFVLSVKPGSYILETSFLGYHKNYINFFASKDSTKIKLPTIVLIENSIQLNDLLVVGEVPSIRVKGDTIEYHAGAYQSSESDVLQDLIRKMPGIELDAKGNLTANGKAIDRILIDGKEFFGNNIQLALKDLPASMINKIQLFKKSSDMAEHTGFKDDEEEQVLNLTVKEEAKRSIFGELEAGYGNDNRYNAKGNAYYMNGENQQAANFDLNNVSSDYGMMGLDENKNGGINLNLKKSEKLEFRGNVYYLDNENLLETVDDTETFISSGNRVSNQFSVSKSTRRNIDGNFGLTWKPDSITRIDFNLRGGHSSNNSRRTSSSLSYVRDTTAVGSDNRTSGTADNINTSLIVSRELGKKGRRLALSFNANLRSGDDKGTNYSMTHYSVDSIQSKEIDQRLKSTNKMNSWSSSISYVEPIGKNKSIRLMYSVNKNNSERDKETLKKDEFGEYSIIDTAYSRNSTSDYTTQNLSLSFQSRGEKFDYTLGLAMQPSRSSSTILFRDSIIDDVKQSVVNYVPTFNITYKPTDSKNLSFYYQGRTSQPGLSQLSSDTTILSATSISYGNPNLKASFDNNLNLSYYTSNTEKNTYLNLSGTFNYTFNTIANYTKIDDLGNYESTYRNVNGNMNASLGLQYSAPIKKVTLTTYTGVNYTKSKGFVNGEDSKTDNYGLNESLTMSYSSDKFDAHLNTAVSCYFTKSNLSTVEGSKTISPSISSVLVWRAPFDFTLSSDANYTLNTGYSDNFKKSNFLCNFTVKKRVMKEKKGEIKLYLYNILDSKNDVSRVVTDNFISYSKSNSISRYFLLSFSYKFKIFKGGGDASSEFMPF